MVRGDSALRQLPPALSISGASLGSEDAFYEARAGVPAGRFRGAECRGRKLEEDVCLVPHGSYLPLQRESGHCLGAPLGLLTFSDSSSKQGFTLLSYGKMTTGRAALAKCPGSDLLPHFSASLLTLPLNRKQKKQAYPGLIKGGTESFTHPFIYACNLFTHLAFTE